MKTREREYKSVIEWKKEEKKRRIRHEHGVEDYINIYICMPLKVVF